MSKTARLVPVLFALLIAASTPSGAQDIVNAGDTPQVKIHKYEAYLRHHKGYAGFTVHNELRHLYGSIDIGRSMYHSNVILANEPLNDYIMSVLSEWTLKDNPDAAIANLTRVAATYPALHTASSVLAAVCDDLRAARRRQ
jgi:hypothetical protein